MIKYQKPSKPAAVTFVIGIFFILLGPVLHMYAEEKYLHAVHSVEFSIASYLPLIGIICLVVAIIIDRIIKSRKKK